MGKIEEIGDRIQALVNTYAKGKNTVFASTIGTSEANVRNYIKGVLPKSDILGKIVTSFDISADWLLTGRGEMSPEQLSTSTTNAFDDRLFNMLKEYITKSEEQAVLIGKLQTEIEFYKKKNQDVTDVGDVGCAVAKG